jgi:ABC-type multidrug transport system ATPase subunit
VQRLSLARALLHEPSVLLLDEAETGLDVRARDLLVEALCGELTAILATHDLSYVADVADEVVFLNRGRVVGRCSLAGVTAAELRERYAEALAQRPAAEKGTAAAGTPTSTAKPAASTSEASRPVGVAD